MPPEKSILPVSAFLDQGISLPALRILGLLGNYADKEGCCFPSQSTIAKRLGLSRTTVNYHLKKLCALGYLETERRTDKNGSETSCLYRIISPAKIDTPLSMQELTPPPASADFDPYPVNTEIDTPLSMRELTPSAASADFDPYPVNTEIDTPLSMQELTPSAASADFDPYPVNTEIDTPLSMQELTPSAASADFDPYPVNTEIDTPVNAGIDTPCQSMGSTQTVNLTFQLTDSENNKQEEVNLPRAREEHAAADFSAESLEIPDDPFGDSLWATPPEAPETPEEVNCQAILPGNKPDQAQYPETLTEARNHPDIQIYRRVTGVLPYASYYKAVVDAIQFLRESCPTDDSLVKYLTPFWQKWKSSTRKDGQPYNPNKPAWLTDWAVTSANPHPINQQGEEECGGYSYYVTSNPTPAQLARADIVIFEEV